MKFRDLGLGPFAPLRSGLGAPTGREKPHKMYGMSQMYGSGAYYGPYGLLKKKPSTCMCMVSETELAQQTCSCLQKRSDLEMKPICGYGTCPFAKRVSSHSQSNRCCMRNSTESAFFIPNFVPKKKVHCKSSVCPCTRSQTSADKCACTANELPADHVPCGHKECGEVKATCDCQKRDSIISRRRGGEDYAVCKISNTLGSSKNSTLSTDSTHNNVGYCRCFKVKRSSREKLTKDSKNKKNERKIKQSKNNRLRAGMDKCGNDCAKSLKCKDNCLGPSKCICSDIESEQPKFRNSLIWRENWSPNCFQKKKEFEDNCCDGWTEEPLFYNQKMTQSYGCPAPRFPDPKVNISS